MLFCVPAYSQLPDMLRTWRSAVHGNLFHRSQLVRQGSLQTLLLEVRQGLEYPADCIAKVVALLLDASREVRLLDAIHSRRGSWLSPSWSTSASISTASSSRASLLRGLQPWRNALRWRDSRETTSADSTHCWHDPRPLSASGSAKTCSILCWESSSARVGANQIGRAHV